MSQECLTQSDIEYAIDLFNKFDRNIAYAAIMTLTKVYSESKEETLQGIKTKVDKAAKLLTEKVSEMFHLQPFSLQAACDFYIQLMNQKLSKKSNLKLVDLKKSIDTKGKQIAEMAMKSRDNIVQFGKKFIRDGSILLVHGHSKTVECLLLAAAHTSRFMVILSTYPTLNTKEGDEYIELKAILEKHNIQVKIVSFNAIGIMMHKIDFVLVGAEAVMENGGIVNKVGTYPLAICSLALKKPFYVVVERFKFMRHIPLTQDDVDSLFNLAKHGSYDHTLSDFTPPEYITLLFTDLGIFTPLAVSDVLISFYSS